MSPHREPYKNTVSESARGALGRVSYLSVRVPFRSKCRFSVMFPGALSGFEAKYFDGQSWARTFSDSRVGVERAGTGYLLPWSDEAAGTERLFDEIWSSVKELPVEVAELHSDGKFLRVLLSGSPEKIDQLEYPPIKGVLLELSRKIHRLPVTPTKRIRLNDRIPVMKWGLGAVVLFTFVAIFATVMPPTSYLYSQTAVLIVSGITVSLFMSLVMRYRGNGLLHAAQLAMFVSIVALFLGIAGYMRLNYMMRGDGEWQEWKVTRVKERYRRYTKEIQSYRVTIVGPAAAQDEISVSPSRFAKLTITAGAPVQVRLHTDLIGLRFMDSAIYQGPSNAATPSDAELL